MRLHGANIETKARCDELVELARRSEEAGARYAGRLDQTDTYFDVRGFRLKLREYAHRHPDGRTGSAAELIRYERPDLAGARVSEYERTSVADPRACREELGAEHGIRTVVAKHRELWIFGSTRIHLDSVEGLGDFVELETVVGDDSMAAYRAEHARVLAILGVHACDAIEGSYADLSRLQPAPASRRARR